MGLFERDEEEISGPTGPADAATGALSVTVVENEFVTGVYAKLASVYDVVFGPALNAGRRHAVRQMTLRPGDSVLEVGIGTAISAELYPRESRVIGVDLSDSMLDRARQRLQRKGIGHIRLLQMDAAQLRFPDESFDVVYAPYVISVVPDPVAVAHEMRRVCRPGGRIIILNHFRSTNPVVARIEQLVSPLTLHVGLAADLDLPAFLARAGLRPATIEKVNFPPVWSLVTCINDR
jgi:phosphatidylethanolamine/phosphatidyl-N-methylethanolamine N-methyltransferase